MASIKATIKLETTTLFPVPVGFTVPVVETVNLDAAFSTVAIQPSSTEAVYTPAAAVGTSNVVYFYAQAPSTNTTDVIIRITDTSLGSANAMRLSPGDFAWFPINASGPGVNIQFQNLSATFESTVYYFYGEKG